MQSHFWLVALCASLVLLNGCNKAKTLPVSTAPGATDTPANTRPDVMPVPSTAPPTAEPLPH